MKIICKICQQKYKNYLGLTAHVRQTHKISSKEYYDKYLKKKAGGICPECGNETTFRGIPTGYLTYCSIKCQAKSKEVQEKRKQTNLKNLGVNNPNKCKEVREKIKQTNLDKYGVDCPLKLKEIYDKTRETKIEQGYHIAFENLENYYKYRRLVTIETRKWKNQLYENWNGFDYYTNEKLITNEEYRKIEPLKHVNYNLFQPTIDHKISIFQGFQEGILPMIIGHINNLAICGKQINSSKGINKYGN